MYTESCTGYFFAQNSKYAPSLTLTLTLTQGGWVPIKGAAATQLAASLTNLRFDY